MPFVAFCIYTVIVLVATAIFGGVPWLVIAVLGLATHYVAGRTWGDAGLLALALIWMFMFHLTGYRQLFFPFSLYIAVYVAVVLSQRSVWSATGCGAIVVLTFLTIRMLQDAPLRVLKIELLVAAAIMAIFVGAYLLSPRNLSAKYAIAILASFAAVGSLSI